jgi:hypothetical protein
MKFKIPKYIIKIILITAILGGGFTGGYYTRKKIENVKIIKEKIYIKGETKTKWYYRKVPRSYDDYKKAYSSPILINGYVKNQVLNVECTDKWKTSTKGFKLATKGNWKVYFAVGIVGVGAGIGLGYGIYKLIK